MSLSLFASHLYGATDDLAFRVDLVDGEPGFTLTNCDIEHHENLSEYWAGSSTPEGSPIVFEGVNRLTNRSRRVVLP